MGQISPFMSILEPDWPHGPKVLVQAQRTLGYADLAGQATRCIASPINVIAYALTYDRFLAKC